MIKGYFGNSTIVRGYMGGTEIWREPTVTSETFVDFVGQTYIKDGQPTGFSDIFAFNRATKAWIQKPTGIVEFAEDVPRFDDGLIIERESTNYVSYSFLPETGVNYLKGGVVFSDGYWTLIPSDPDVYLYPRPYPPAIPVGAVASLGTTTPADFSYITVNGYLNEVTQEGLVNYAIVDSVNNLSPFGAVLDGVNTLGAVQLQYLQLEEGSVPTSPIKTQGAPVTRAADVLKCVNPILGVNGDWDSGLSVRAVSGELIISGSGRIRSMTVLS